MSGSSSAREELPRGGIEPEDEGLHAHCAEHESWTESYFWDWFDERGEVAGHCRFALHPNQERAWLWLHLHRGSEWIALEEPRLPLAAVRKPELAYDGWGLRFSWEPTDPLRAGRLRARGFARVVRGPRAGTVLPVGVDLGFECTAPPYSRGPSRIDATGGRAFPANRYEQPTVATGTLELAGERVSFRGRGTRDHAWGPRSWNMEWEVATLHLPGQWLRASVARIPGVGRIATGTLHREAPVPLRDVEFRLQYRDGDLLHPVSGSLCATAEDRSVIAGSLEPITAAEIDDTHVLDPPQRTLYRRALVRFEPRRHGWKRPAPSLGWFESHRLVD